MLVRITLRQEHYCALSIDTASQHAPHQHNARELLKQKTFGTEAPSREKGQTSTKQYKKSLQNAPTIFDRTIFVYYCTCAE